MRSAIAVLAAGLMLGCSDPAGRCRDGNHRAPGPGCAVPMLVSQVDGVADEWSDPALFATPLCADDDGDCEPGNLRALQGARQVDGGALFLLATVGAPATVDAEYRLVLTPITPRRIDEDSSIAGRSTQLELRIRPDGVRVLIGDHEVLGLPEVEAVYGPDGIELRVPAEVLITRGGFAYLQRREPAFPGDTVWSAVQDTIFGAPPAYCWFDDDDSPCHH